MIPTTQDVFLTYADMTYAQRRAVMAMAGNTDYQPPPGIAHADMYRGLAVKGVVDVHHPVRRTPKRRSNMQLRFTALGLAARQMCKEWEPMIAAAALAKPATATAHGGVR